MSCFLVFDRFFFNDRRPAPAIFASGHGVFLRQGTLT